MRRPHARKAVGLGFDHRLETVPPQRALLLQIDVDFRQVILGNGFVQQGSIRLRPIIRRRAQCKLCRMQAKQRIISPTTQGRATRPSIGRGVIGDAGADRVEVDAADAAQRIVLAIDQACLVATLPERSRSPMAGIEQCDIAPAHLLHENADGAGFTRSQQQMNVVVHKDVSMQPAAGRVQRFPEDGQVVKAILIVQEAREAIVAALHDMLRNIGQVDSGKSGHMTIPAAP